MSEDVASAGPRAYASSRAANPGISAPSGHAFRRAQTFDEASAARRRPTLTSIASDAPPEPSPRRSSNFSEYSFGEANDILNPAARSSRLSTPETSSLPSLSLAFALLPALAGALFKDGSAVVTDIMLLGLAGIFLHWSVTQPWTWYRSAQAVRIENQVFSEEAIEDDTDSDDLVSAQATKSPLDDVPEEQAEVEQDLQSDNPSESAQHLPRMSPQQKSALSELYVYEVAALLSCALLPAVGAYLLHAIRSQLSRPSEGLVSNYNLTIFLLVSELRVFSHVFKLVHARTLHLQKVVHANSFTSQANSSRQIEQVLERLERLEVRSAAEQAFMQQNLGHETNRAKQDASIVRDVRNAIQPELDALNRAVRRYEKKATVLQFQTESRFAALDARLGDAIALAAAAAKNSASRKGVLTRAIETATVMLTFPIRSLLRIILLPLTSVVAVFSRKRRNTDVQRPARTTRPGKSQSQSRYSGDRVPGRVARR